MTPPEGPPVWTALISLPSSTPPQTSKTISRRVVPMGRSEEHTSEVQSRQYLVRRLLLEKKFLGDRQTTAGRHRRPRSHRGTLSRLRPCASPVESRSRTPTSLRPVEFFSMSFS